MHIYTEAATVADMITNDEEFTKLVGRLRDAISHAFGACDECMQSFEPFRDMVDEHEKLDPLELLQGAQQGQITLDDFKEKLVTYSTQSSSIFDVTTLKGCGIFQVNAQKLKEMIAPSPAVCLEKIEVLLPQLAMIRQKNIFDKISTANSQLNHSPDSVPKYISLMEFLVECTATKDKIDKEFLELQSHFELMDLHEVKVNEMDRAAYKMLLPGTNVYVY